MYVTFAHPKYLFFLFLVPILFFIHFVTLKSGKKIALKFANFEAIARISGVDFFSKNITILLLSSLLVCLLTMAVSGLTLHMQLEASSFSFVLAIDSSQSMEADDMYPSRLSVAKDTAIEFVNSAPRTTKIGVVSFAGSALIEQDLTENKDSARAAIKNIEINAFGGTDLYEAIITSTNLLKSEEARSIILLSDGQINIGRIDDCIEYANENDVVVHTIAIGTEEGGKTGYGISKLDEDSLKALAYNTGGIFFKATNKDELSNALKEAMKLTKRKVAIDISNYLIIISIILFIFEYILVNTKYKLFP